MRYQPGQSGNPAGRPRGSLNKAAIVARQQLDERHRPIDFDMPKLGTAADAAVATNAIAQGLSHGELTPREAAVLTRIVRDFVLGTDAADLRKRIARIEAHLADAGTGRAGAEKRDDDDDRVKVDAVPTRHR